MDVAIADVAPGQTGEFGGAHACEEEERVGGATVSRSDLHQAGSFGGRENVDSVLLADARLFHLCEGRKLDVLLPNRVGECRSQGPHDVGLRGWDGVVSGEPCADVAARERADLLVTEAVTECL